MKRKLFLYLVLAFLVLVALSAYVGWSARRELNAARGVLDGSTDQLTSADISEARQHLESADSILNGWAARIARLVPVARQNIQAADAAVDAGLPVLDDAGDVTAARDRLRSADLVRDGRVQLETIEELERPVTEQLTSLTALERELETHRSGWLLPPVWDAVDGFERRTEELRESVEAANNALAIAPALLGAEEPRTYLVVLLNNAELRGGGGLLSGVGTITATDGRLQLGSFFYQGDLRTRPPEEVPAPADFVRRFDRYRANTTVWVNTSASPDIPEVADVASRLFEQVQNVQTDGALVIDPRGISSLLPTDTQMAVPRTDVTVTEEGFVDFIYSDSYEVLEGGDPRRKTAILALGHQAFRAILNGGGGGSETLESAGDAVSGGHIRFVSFDPVENDILDQLGVTGSLSTNATDNLLVTIQNLGADKLDYWIRRHIEHECSFVDETVARCESRVELHNTTPRGLDDFVTQVSADEKRGYPYGTYVGYLEVYVPESAELTGVTLDGTAERFFPEIEDGRKSLGMYFTTLRQEATTAVVSYELPLPDAGYSLELTEQPLTHDATVEVTIRGPKDWLTSGPGTRNEGTIRFQGNLDGALRFEVRPAGATGITGLWRTLVEFWTEPLG